MTIDRDPISLRQLDIPIAWAWLTCWGTMARSCAFPFVVDNAPVHDFGVPLHSALLTLVRICHRGLSEQETNLLLAIVIGSHTSDPLPNVKGVSSLSCICCCLTDHPILFYASSIYLCCQNTASTWDIFYWEISAIKKTCMFEGTYQQDPRGCQALKMCMRYILH